MRRASVWSGLLAAALTLAPGGVAPANAQPSAGIQRVRASILAVGTYQATRVPPFRFLGTGFVVLDGTHVATNAHVLPAVLEAGSDPEVLVAMQPSGESSRAAARRLARVAVDDDHDLALLKFDGPALVPLTLRDSASVVEGDQLLFTGFPIGNVLGLFPATHRAMVAAIAPVALPSASGRELDAKVVRRLRDAPFLVFQLDATAFPGHSGSPLYDPVTGDVVGVVNMVFVKSTKEAVLAQPSGISYAIPSRFLIELLERAKR